MKWIIKFLKGKKPMTQTKPLQRSEEIQSLNEPRRNEKMWKQAQVTIFWTLNLRTISDKCTKIRHKQCLLPDCTEFVQIIVTVSGYYCTSQWHANSEVLNSNWLLCFTLSSNILVDNLENRKKCCFNWRAWGLSGCLSFSFLSFFFRGRGGVAVVVIVIDSCVKRNH